MPHIELKAAASSSTDESESFFYTISTPTSPSASSSEIVQELPTIVLIHPVYAGSVLWHPVFADCRLRRFNLVAMDLRGHGETKAGVGEDYGRDILAGDVLRIMDSLDIAEFHVAGVATGASVALQMAVMAPERVRSVFMVSPAPQIEPAESLQGRQEIVDYWVQAHQNDSTEVDEIAAADAVYGALQLAYNNKETRLTKAVCSYGVSNAKRNWTGDCLHRSEIITVKYFSNETPFDVSSLKRIRAETPVMLIHGSEDIVYPRFHAEELLGLLRTAGLGKAELLTLEGAPHFANVTHPEEINKFLYDFIAANCGSAVKEFPPPPQVVESRFLEELAKYGYLEDDTDSDGSE
ncbi:AB hydrolase-1 domain-containing protein [Favolaschia claudopus]|uniref:AB hydrolase-1 domain-containing protein n=1 Tax=Favolaschia claudopus TaxID=2862362 RepID=A0AAW0DNY1_9AGAR